MSRIVCRLVVVLCFCSVLLSVAAAQPPTKEGTVERVVLIHINAGHGDAFWTDMKKNTQPIWDAQKAAGMIVDYQWFVNQTASSPDDWNVGYSLIYKNMAALDGLADKAYDIRMKHYGDSAAEQKVVDKRVDNAHVVSSFLIRNVTIR